MTLLLLVCMRLRMRMLLLLREWVLRLLQLLRLPRWGVLPLQARLWCWLLCHALLCWMLLRHRWWWRRLLACTLLRLLRGCRRSGGSL